jgi:exodeoxyribonuclease VII large subunit
VRAVTAAQERLSQQERGLGLAMRHAVDRQHDRLAACAARLDALSPLAVLARGYAIVQDQNGAPVLNADPLKHRQMLTITLAQGSTQALVDKPNTAQAPLF